VRGAAREVQVRGAAREEMVVQVVAIKRHGKKSSAVKTKMKTCPCLRNRQVAVTAVRALPSGRKSCQTVMTMKGRARADPASGGKSWEAEVKVLFEIRRVQSLEG
jgi:hypothetical protein